MAVDAVSGELVSISLLIGKGTAKFTEFAIRAGDYAEKASSMTMFNPEFPKRPNRDLKKASALSTVEQTPANTA